MDAPFSGPGAAPVSLLLLALTVGCSLLAWRPGSALLQRCLLRPYRLFADGRFASLFTSALVHADLPHLLFNGFSFWAFAPGLEQRIGSARFAALYAAGALVSALSTWWRHRAEPGYASLGASGAIAAVLFAAIVYAPGSSIFVLPVPVPIPAPLFAACYLAYSHWAARQARGRVNHDAHFAGAVTGLAFVALLDPGALAAAWRSVTGGG